MFGACLDESELIFFASRQGQALIDFFAVHPEKVAHIATCNRCGLMAIADRLEMKTGKPIRYLSPRNRQYLLEALRSK